MEKQKETVENLIGWTQASELTGLSLWKIKYAVQKGRIKSVPVASRVLLLRDSLLEFAGQK